MPNLQKLTKKFSQKFKDFKPDYKSFGKKSDPDKQEKPGQKEGIKQVGDIENEEEGSEEGGEEDSGVVNLGNKGAVGDVDAEDSDEYEDELFDGQESQEMAEQMSERVKANAIENAQRTASGARKNAASFRKKAKWTIGDLICVILAVIKDIIEILGLVALGLGAIAGPLISFFITVLLFIIKTFQGQAVTRNMIRRTLLWLADVLVIAIPVYTIIMIIQIHNDVKKAKLDAEQQDKIAGQAEATIKHLQKI